MCNSCGGYTAYVGSGPPNGGGGGLFGFLGLLVLGMINPVAALAVYALSRRDNGEVYMAKPAEPTKATSITIVNPTSP